MSDTEPATAPPPPPDAERPRPLPAIRARGRSFTALVLSPEAPLPDWVAALDAQVARSPEFFAAKPVILECGLLHPDDDGLPELLPALLERGIRVVEVDADRSWPALRDWPFPERLFGGRAIGTIPIPEPEPPPPPDPARASLVIDDPVRSGQSVSFPDGDLVVMGSVASGAEVSAGGSIHVYGALRGRALAGINGYRRARILCRRLHAELLAVDGVYLTAEDIPAARLNGPAVVRLEDETLRIAPLD
ncbi:MAG: septum site-determining protein MinC [Gluconacetobacter diazotrophicus]|nr:septum site-determining protein MinC [Gluconacetobacter diazotrophicus]